MIVCGIGLLGMIMQVSIPSFWGLMAGRLVNAVSMGTLLQALTQAEALERLDPLWIVKTDYLHRYRGQHCSNVYGRTRSSFGPRWSRQFLPNLALRRRHRGHRHRLRFDYKLQQQMGLPYAFVALHFVPTQSIHPLTSNCSDHRSV